MRSRDSRWLVDWVKTARERLLGLRRAETGWADQAGTPARVEPTALACLGLLASDPGGTQVLDVARSSAAWLASVQNPDGSLGVSRELAAPGWGTPHAIWLWTATRVRAGARTARAVRWLLERKGVALRADSGDPHRSRSDDRGLALGRRDALLARADRAGHPGTPVRRPGRAIREPRRDCG